MEKITYKNMVQALLSAVPEIKGAYERESSEWGKDRKGNEPPPKWWDNEKDGDWHEDLGFYEFYPHLVYADILCEYIRNISETSKSNEILKRVFNFLEQLASHEEYDVRNVVEVSVFESLGRDDKKTLERVHSYLGPNTKTL